MDIKLINIGFGNVVAANRIIAIISPESAPIKRALAYGHPYGASGAIITLHLLEALKRCRGRLGCASVAAAGGIGTALLLERVEA